MAHRLSSLTLGTLIVTLCIGLWACSRQAARQSNTPAPAATSAQGPAGAGTPDGLQSRQGVSASPSQSNESSEVGSQTPAGPRGETQPSGGSPVSPATQGAASPGSSIAVPPPPPPRTYTLPAGSRISIYTTNTLTTKTAKSGDIFSATLANPIVDRDWVIARRGAPVEGVVISSDPGGRVKGVASLTVLIKRLILADGRRLELPAGEYTKKAPTTRKKDAAKIGIGAGVGALIGGLAGGKKGALIGAGAGGGAGTAYVLATRGDPAVIPAESHLTFRLNSPVRVTRRTP